MEPVAMNGEVQPKSYRLTLDGAGLTVDRDIDEAAARAILNIVLGATPETVVGHTPETAGKTEQSAIGAQIPLDGPPLSLREALEESGANRYPDKIVVIAEHMTTHGGLPDFGRDDIKLRFRHAGETPPKNFGRDFVWAVKNGWIAEDSQNKGKFYVTRKGKEAIDSKFSKEMVKATVQNAGGRRRSRRLNNAGTDE